MDVPRETFNKLQYYQSLVLEWSQKFNLTGAKSPEEFHEKHILDCYHALQLLPQNPLWFDIGSGAGLPGIIWACLRPNESFVLIESLGKRVQFLKHCVEKLHLKNVLVQASRFEDLKEGFIANFGQKPVFVSRGTAGAYDLLKMAKKVAFDWKEWVIFSTYESHLKYETAKIQYSKFLIEKIEYPEEQAGPFKKVLTIIKPH